MTSIRLKPYQARLWAWNPNSIITHVRRGWISLADTKPRPVHETNMSISYISGMLQSPWLAARAGPVGSRPDSTNYLAFLESFRPLHWRKALAAPAHWEADPMGSARL